jgi:hypothetical protein
LEIADEDKDGGLGDEGKKKGKKPSHMVQEGMRMKCISYYYWAEMNYLILGF